MIVTSNILIIEFEAVKVSPEFLYGKRSMENFRKMSPESKCFSLYWKKPIYIFCYKKVKVLRHKVIKH